MNLFIGGFATAFAVLAGAALAGRPWPGLGFGACAVTILAWLVTWHSRHGGQGGSRPEDAGTLPPGRARPGRMPGNRR
jgi:hypothetical protein